MKYGAHAYLWVDRWSDDHLNLLDRAKELGLSCLEIPGGDDAVFTPRTVRRHAQALKLELALSPGGHWPMECDISDDDPHHRQRGLEWHRHMIDLAADSGAVAYTGGLYGHPGKVLRRLPPADEIPRTAENLHRLADHAERRGIKLVIEPMNRYRTHLVNTPQQAMRLVTLADHASLGVVLDTFHMSTEVRDYATAIRMVGKRLWGLHACESDRGCPGGGLVPWREVFEALREIRAENCYLMLESYNTAVGDFGYRRGLFQNLCPDGDSFVRHGLAFLEKQRRDNHGKNRG